MGSSHRKLLLSKFRFFAIWKNLENLVWENRKIKILKVFIFRKS